MANIRIGTSTVAQPDSYDFNPASGQLVTSRVIYDTYAASATAFNAAVAANVEAHLQSLGGGRYEVSTVVPSGVRNSWNLDVQWNDKPAGQSNKFRAWFDALATDALRFQFIADSEWIRNGNAATADPDGWATADSTYKAWAWDVATDATVQEPTAVLRRTITWPAGSSSTTANWTDVNKVWTTAQINSLASPPPAICGTLPTAYWLMLSDEADYGADGRFTASTIWVSGTYPTHRYTYK